MATHSKKISKLISKPYQVFTNDTSATGAVVFATNDIVDFKTSLGRGANNLKIILKGTIAVQLIFNIPVKAIQFNETGADTTIDMPSDIANLNSLRLATTTYLEFELPAGFTVETIVLGSYSGVASDTQNLTFIGF